MDGVDYCETLLAMALKKTLSETAVTTVLKSEVLGDSKDLKELFDSFCDTSESLDLSKDSGKIQSSLKKAVKDLYKDTPSKASKVEGAIGDFIKYSKNIVELCQKVATYSKMLDLDDFTKEWLNRMYEANEINGNDPDMRIALNNLIVASSGDSGFSDLSWARAGFTGVEWIVQKGINEGIKILCRSNPVVAAIFAGLSIGSTICNLFFATDDVCEQLYVMQKFEILQNIARSAMMKCQSGFELVRDIKSAQIFNKAVEMYFHIITDVDCDCMSEFLTKLYTGGYLKDITVKIKGASGDYESCTNAVEDLRNVRRNNYNYIITYCKGGFKLESEESYSYYFGEKSTEIPVESISLRQNNIEINMDGFLNLFPQYTPSDTTQKGVIYTSSDESIIPSGNTGILFPKKAGTVTITLTSIYNSSIKTSVTVTVTDSESGGGSGGSSGGSNIGIIDSGTCGKNLTWKLTEAGTLIISGTGAMSEPSSPWSSNSFIKRAIVANGVTTIGSFAFYNCSSLTSVTIGNSVRAIGDYAFARCTSLTSITIPDSVTSIGESAFDRCTSLTSVTLGNSVTSIEDSAFSDCSSLEDINVASGNNYYSSNNGVLFNKKKTELIRYPKGKSETSYTIPNSVTSIRYSAFARCTSLTSITIPDSVTSIGKSAFAGCTSLTSITIPDSVTSIGYSAFEDCTGLTSINVASNNNCFSSNNGVLFNKKKTELIKYPEGKSQTSYTIPNSVTSIGKRAFIYCSSLTSITISNSVTSIGDGAFYDCTGLKDVYYAGSEAQWKAISVDDYGNDSLLNATIHYNWTGEHVCTNKKLVTVPAQCEVNGMSYYICTECGKQIGEAAIIPATGHSWGEWQVTKDATATTEGSRERECAACGKKETEIIPILAQTAKDDKSGIEVSAPSGSYNGELELEVEEIFDGESFQIVGTIEGQEQSKIYDVTTKVDGKETQPGATVTVKIPLPEGYDPARTYVYHVNSETGKVENMNARYEDGFLVFETDHFSTYAVVQIKAQKKDSIFKKILNVVTAPFRAIINLFKKLFGK